MATAGMPRAAYERDGFVPVRHMLAGSEVTMLRRAVQRIAEIDCPQVVRAGPERMLRAVHGLHLDSGPTATPEFRTVVRLPQMLALAGGLLGSDDVYVHHTRLEVLAAGEERADLWTQGSAIADRDGLASPNVVTIVVALEPWMKSDGVKVVAGSHLAGRLAPYLAITSPEKVWAVPAKEAARLIELRGGAVALEGRPGSAVALHGNLLVAHGPNRSRIGRWHLHVCYNRCDNRPRKVDLPRPEWLCGRDTAALVACDDGEALKTPFARARQP